MEKKFLLEKKKNILDLQYSKYLQFFNTSIVVLFTYIIGLAIAFFTRQIDFKNLGQMLLIGGISVFFFSVLVLLILLFRREMEIILSNIRKLKI